ncbi:hypothetical protein ASF61_22345 [Duganella sp. Leaf126]|uniref:hemagglutinin repeat-containing protein n=1 Tax=Duganella sp. Leaf126 TaxID=1736266 RepID=UPI0006F64AD5|nr:hemagglutinin repeat-containing protein [Duganella sp. Leaf126]KQQ39107.1 hypothetical protein ASF61_22345 [Duganella sp. Leaf126]
MIANAGVNGTTGLAAGHDLNLKTVDIASSHDVVRNADNYSKQSMASEVGSQITGAGDVSLRAGNDLVAKAAKVEAEGKLELFAGNDISVLNGVETERTDTASKVKKKGTFSSKTTVTRDTVETSSALGSSLSGAAVTIAAGHDLTVAASSVQAQDALNLLAKNDVSIGAVGLASAESHTRDVRKSGSFGLSKTSIAQADATTATNVFVSSVAGGAVTVQAGQDIGIAGSHLTAENALSLDAGRDLLIGSVGQSGSEQHSYEKKKSGFSFNVTSGNLGYSKLQDQTAGKDQTLTQIGSELSAGSLVAVSGRDAAISGSKIVADNDLVIAAGRDLTITSAQNTSDGASSSSSTKSGSIGTRFQPAIGTVKTTQDSKFDSVSQVGSQVASLGGDVKLKAGKNYTQTSSDVLAPEGDISILANKVLINAATNINNSTDHTTYAKTAIGGTVTAPAVEAIKSAAGMVKAAGNTSDSRMQALAALNAAGSLSSMPTSLAAVQNAGVHVSLSLGNSKSESNTVQASQTAIGSSVSAGGNVNVTASGAGKESDVIIAGGELQAGKEVTLAADHDVNLLASTSTASQHSTNKSSGSSVGIGFGIGGTSNGFTIDLAASQARGKGDGDDRRYTNTHVNAGEKVTVVSGNDTTLKGAVVTAVQVVADIKGNLNIESLQDSSKFDSKQSSSGVNASICVPPFCYGASTVGTSVSKSKVSGDFLSVLEQSGIKTGDGGFQVMVGGNTALVGGLLSSSQQAVDAGRNVVTTGSLTASDLQNRDSFSASGYAFSGSVSGSGAKESDIPDETKRNLSEEQLKAATADGKPGASAGFGSVSGSQTSTTASAISGGSVSITDASKQLATGKDTQAALASIDRSVTTESMATTDALTKGWDAKALQQEVDARVAITQEFSKQAPKAIADYSDKQIAEIDQKLLSETDPLKKAELLDERKSWSEGGTYRVALHTVSGALTGGVSGALGAGGVASMANQMEKLQSYARLALEDRGYSPESATVLAQGLAELTSIGIGGAVGGVAGAANSVAVDTNNRQLHPKEIAWIAKNATAFAKELAEKLERPVTAAEAMSLLTTAGEANVDKLAMTAMELTLGPATMEETRAYFAAKQYIAGNAKGIEFTDDSGVSQKMLVAKTSDFYNGMVYRQYNNDANYREFFWKTTGENLKPDNPTPGELQIYNERETTRLIAAAKGFSVGALVGGIGAVAGKWALRPGTLTASPATVMEGQTNTTFSSGAVSEGGKTVTLYRVDDVGFAQRIAADGTVPVVTTASGSERTLFVNIGQPLRAQEFALVNRKGDAIVTAVEVDFSFLEKLRATAVYDKGDSVKANPTAPLKVDINRAPDQFGLRTAEQIQWLREAIKPNTTRIVDPKTLH